MSEGTEMSVDELGTFYFEIGLSKTESLSCLAVVDQIIIKSTLNQQKEGEEV